MSGSKVRFEMWGRSNEVRDGCGESCFNIAVSQDEKWIVSGMIHGLLKVWTGDLLQADPHISQIIDHGSTPMPILYPLSLHTGGRHMMPPKNFPSNSTIGGDKLCL